MDGVLQGSRRPTARADVAGEILSAPFAIGAVAATAVLSVAVSSSGAKPPSPMVVVNERDVMRDEPAPHGNHGMSTAYRMSDAVPNRTMEFRKRTLHVGSAI